MNLPKLFRSAFVIARRDFTATVMSKTFLLFLLGPLFPLAVGIGFGGLGDSIERNVERPVVAVVGSPDGLSGTRRSARADGPACWTRTAASCSARSRRPATLPRSGECCWRRRNRRCSACSTAGSMRRISPARSTPTGGRCGNWRSSSTRPAATRAGAPAPAGTAARGRTDRQLVGLDRLGPVGHRLRRSIGAVHPDPAARRHAAVAIDRGEIEQGDRGDRRRGADRIDLHRQIVRHAGDGLGRDRRVDRRRRRRRSPSTCPAASRRLPAPAVGWPMFIALGILYFSMSYLLIGSLFLGIGARPRPCARCRPCRCR